MGPDEIQLLSQLIQANADNTNKKQYQATQQVMRNQTLRANQAENATNRQWKSNEAEKARNAKLGLKELLLENQDKADARTLANQQWMTKHRDSTTAENQKWQSEQASDLRKFMLQFQTEVEAIRRGETEANRRYDKEQAVIAEENIYKKIKARTAEDYPLNTSAIKASLGQFLTEEGGFWSGGLNESDMMDGWNNMLQRGKLPEAVNTLKSLPADHPKKIQLLSLLAEMQTKASDDEFTDGGPTTSGKQEQAVGDQIQLWIDTLTR